MAFDATVTTTNWGRLRLVVWVPGGAQTDVTFFRDVPVSVESWSSVEPFSDERIVLRFPQITALDTFGSGDLDWLVQWANIDMQRVHPDEVTTTTLWEGLISSWRITSDEEGAYCELVCLGAIYQLGLYRRAPGLSDAADPIDDVMAVQFDSVNSKPALRTQPLTVEGGPTGITTRTKGAWESDLEYVQEELAKCQTAAGDQWTIDLDRPRQPVLRKKDRTTVDWTVTAGQPGLVLDVSQDFVEAYNVVYGESQDEAGSTIRNQGLGSDGMIRYAPLSYASSVHNLAVNETTGIYESDGGTVDTSVVRVEKFFNFGEGINRNTAMDLADNYRARDGVLAWVGTMRLKVGPEEAAQFGIRAGDNIKVKEFNGSGQTGVLFHVARVEFTKTDTSYEAALTVDTKARDFLALEEIIRRNRKTTSPARQLRAGRSSGIVQDDNVPWDGKVSGWYPMARAWDGASTVSLTANTWSITKIQMAGGPLMITRSEFRASAACAFGVYVFDWNIPVGDLPSDPFGAGVWDDEPAGYLMGWGCTLPNGQTERAGYWPGLQGSGDSPTGVLVYENEWEIPPRRGEASTGPGDASNASISPFLYVAVFSTASCTMWGRFSHGG